ncbi:MAG: hypothetical protein ACOC0A_03325 [Planctomycetota bacterium]
MRAKIKKHRFVVTLVFAALCLAVAGCEGGKSEKERLQERNQELKEEVERVRAENQSLKKKVDNLQSQLGVSRHNTWTATGMGVFFVMVAVALTFVVAKLIRDKKILSTTMDFIGGKLK